jgi:hypothetical protein
VKLELKDYISFVCGGKKSKQVSKGAEKIFEKIDIINLIQKMIEIDKLKMLLLTPE